MAKRISEQAHRSLFKSITFRVLVLVADIIVFFVLTKKATDAINLTIITNIASTLLYYVHERLWNRVHWGRR